VGGRAVSAPAEALAACDRALAQAPRRAELHHQRGLALFQLGRLEEAAASFARAATLRPDLAEAHFLHGAAQHARGRPDLALPCYERALALRPDLAEAQLNRGVALRALGQAEAALASYDRAVALRPDWADACLNRANLLKDLGRHAAARHDYDRAIALAPGAAPAWLNRGALAEATGDAAAALADYQQAVILAPGLAAAWFARGNALAALGRAEAALDSYDRAVALQPDLAEARLNRGRALETLGRLDAALDNYAAAVALRPGWPEALSNQGAALREAGRLDAALAAFDQALAAAPERAELHYNRGLVLYAQGAFLAAADSYQRALTLRPEYGEAALNRAISLLTAGDFARGWPAFEARWRIEPQASLMRSFPQPRWSGDAPLAGRRLLLYSEQGYGDTLQMCRYIPLLAAQGAWVALEVEPPLLPLLRGLPGLSALVAKGDPLPAFDIHCPLLSLPLACGTTLDTIPAAASYLTADPARRTAWAERLGPEPGRRIGLAWSGHARHKNDRHRTLPLAALTGLLAEPGLGFLSLQRELRPDDAALLPTLPLRHFGEDLTDFAETAALCDLVDLVISVDTSVAHLAGALGRPTWILLPAQATDWRWLTGRRDSPWYPSVTLYRQRPGEGWEAVLERVRADLRGSPGPVRSARP